MRLNLPTNIAPVALAALAALALGPVACSDDGVPTQQGGTTGTGDGNGSGGISTTMTTGSMTSPADDGADDTGIGTTDSPSPDTGDGTTDAPATTTAEDGTGSDTGDTGSGTSTSDDSGTSGDGSGSSSDSGGEPLCDASSKTGALPVGAECAQDSACASGVCWDFADYDALCGGTGCSVCCTTDDDCVTAMQAAGAPFPAQTLCGDDGRCDLLGTGMGGPFFCAGR